MTAATESQACSDEKSVRPGNKRGKVVSTGHRPLAKKGTDGISEYQDRYRWFKFRETNAKLKKTKAERVFVEKERMDLLTSYDKNYVEHKIKPIPKRQKEVYSPPTGKMAAKTAYQDTYTKKEMVEVGSCGPVRQFHLPSKRTDVVSEYQTMFVPREVARPKAAKLKECLEIPTDKFNEVSTVQHDYREHKNFKRVLPIYQAGRGLDCQGPFYLNTVYRDCYTPKNIRPRPPKLPIESLPDGPHFTDSVVLAAEKMGPPRPASFPVYKPSKIVPSLNLDTRGDQKEYKRWPQWRPGKPLWTEETKFEPPRQQMHLNTTYDTEYKDPKVVPAVPPMVTLLGRKTLKLDVPVEGTIHLLESTNRANFTGQYAPASKPCYPASDNWHATTCGQLPFITTYMDSYLGENAAQRRLRRLNKKKALRNSEEENQNFIW